MDVAGLLALVFTCLFFRMNAVVLLLALVAYVHLVWGDGRLEYLVEDMWISLDNDLLLAIPMFLIAGNIMTRGSIAKRLIRVTMLATDPLPGAWGWRRCFPALCSPQSAGRRPSLCWLLAQSSIRPCARRVIRNGSPLERSPRGEPLGS